MEKLFKAIAAGGGTSYIVGGAVRDHLMGIAPKDKDYVVCGLKADQLVDILNQFGYVKLVGQSFGVYKVMLFGTQEIIDVALPRKETSTGIAHDAFDIDSGPHITIEQDLHRRDYTANSICINSITGQVIDPLNGQQDIKNKVLRVNHSWSFFEDPLRILRGVQFAARFNFSLTKDTLAYMARYAELIPRGVTAERVAIELCKLMKSPKPSVGLRLMRDTNVLPYVWPELHALVGLQQNQKYHKFDVFEHSITACDNMMASGKNLVWRRILALCHDVGKAKRRQFKNIVDIYGKEAEYKINYYDKNVTVITPAGKYTVSMEDAGEPCFLGHDDAGAEMAEDMFHRMKFSSVSNDAVPDVWPSGGFPLSRCVHMIKNHMFFCDCESTPRSLRKFIATIGRENIFDQIRLRIADRSAKGIPHDLSEWITFAKKLRTIRHGSPTAFSIKNLAIDGNDIMKFLNIKPGPKVGSILHALFEKIIENPNLNTRDQLLELASAVLPKD